MFEFVTVCDNACSLRQAGNNHVFTSGYYQPVTNLLTLAACSQHHSARFEVLINWDIKNSQLSVRYLEL